MTSGKKKKKRQNNSSHKINECNLISDTDVLRLYYDYDDKYEHSRNRMYLLAEMENIGPIYRKIFDITLLLLISFPSTFISFVTLHASELSYTGKVK